MSIVCVFHAKVATDSGNLPPIQAKAAADWSCPPTLRTIPLAQKPRRMPPSHDALEGARPWSRIFFTTHSPYAFSCGSSSCCTSLGPSQVCPPHLYQRSPSASVPPSPNRSRALRKSPSVPCVSKRPESARQRLRDGPIPCPQHTAAPVPWTPRYTFVPTPIVTITVG
jgi:hypothetical protein